MAESTTNKAHVLVVDDEEHITELVERLVERGTGPSGRQSGEPGRE